MGRGRGGAPRGAHVTPTWHARGGHVAATRAAGWAAPIHPGWIGRRRGGTRPARTDGSSRPGDHGAAAARHRRRPTDGGGDAADGGYATALPGEKRRERRRGVLTEGVRPAWRKMTATRNDGGRSTSGGQVREGEREIIGGGNAGRRRRPRPNSPAHGAVWVPAAESDGEGVNGVALRLANPKVATARLGGGSCGGEWRPKVAKAAAVAGEKGAREGREWADFAGVVGRWREGVAGGIQKMNPGRFGAGVGGREREWAQGSAGKVATWAAWLGRGGRQLGGRPPPSARGWGRTRQVGPTYRRPRVRGEGRGLSWAMAFGRPSKGAGGRRKWVGGLLGKKEGKRKGKRIS
uniref:Uncharacterized protein n=1 Tax=Oryza glaberrima TaxID=4538 RepID=A0A679BE61_ORYGL|nr:hypothetical protein [Oryza glaberrima]